MEPPDSLLPEPTPLCLRHMEAFGQVVRAGRPMALTRWGDGERAILQNREISTYHTNRHWCYRPSLGISYRQLSVDLAAAFDFDQRSIVLVSNYDRDWQRARHSLPQAALPF